MAETDTDTGGTGRSLLARAFGAPLRTGVLGIASAAAFGVATPALADDPVKVHYRPFPPTYAPPIYTPPPVVYVPPPVYYGPPVYIAPPIYVAPRVVIVPGHGHGYRHHHHHGHHWGHAPRHRVDSHRHRPPSFRPPHPR